MPRPVIPHRLLELAGDRLRRIAVSAALVLSALPTAAQQPAADGTAPRQPAANETGTNQPGGADASTTAGDAALDANDQDASPAPKTKSAPLPPDFTPPAPVPEVITLKKLLMTQAEVTKADNELRRLQAGGSLGINAILKSGDLNPATKDAIHRWAKVTVAKMTAVDDWQKLGGIHRDTMLRLRTAGMAQTNSNRQRDFRREVCAAMTEACSSVLDNNFYVRIQAATILSQLNEREAPTTGTPVPPVSYVPALKPLLDIVADGEQPEAVRIAAVKGVGRIAQDAESIDAETRFLAGDLLTKALADPNSHPWYQMRISEALAAIKLEFDRNRQPIVLTALLQAVGDDKRSCLARTAAAKALGRIPLPAGAWNDRAAADALRKLAHDMSVKYNKSPNKVEWYECFANLYLTAKNGPQDDVARLPTSSLLRKGTLTAPLDDLYKQLTPVAQHVLSQPVGGNHKPIPTELLQPLAPAPVQQNRTDNRQAVSNR